jgi:TonB family protein
VEAEPRATTSGSAQSAAPSAAGATGAWTGDRTVGTGPAARGSDAAGAAASQGPRDGTQAALAVPGGRGAGDGAEYAGYYDLLRRRVLDTLKYPTLARRRGLTGTVQVELEIQPTGAISKVEIVASSSHRVLDDAAVEAVHRLGRLPVPAHLPPRLLRVRLPVVFELQ